MSEQWRDAWPSFIVRTDTEQARALLDRYFGLQEGGLPLYTGAAFERFVDAEHPDIITEKDLVAITMLSVHVPARAAIRLLDTDRERISELLAAIPSDLDIVDAQPVDLGSTSPAGRLWGVLRTGRDGLGPTKTSKLLAAKRPRLLPVWDRLVGEATAMGTRDHWATFQSVLTADDRRIWDWLVGLTQEHDGMHGVTPLRALDVLLWTWADQRSH